MSKRAEQKSIEWQMAHHPMAIGGDNFADFVEYFNINPAYVAGYEQAEEDFALTWEDIAKIDSLILETNNEFAVDHQKEISRQHFYEEVLKKYLQIKKRTMKAVKIAYNRRNGTFSIQAYHPSHKSWEKRPVGFKTIGIIPESIVDKTLDDLSKFIEEETGTDDRVLAKMRGQIMVFLADYLEALN